MTCRIFFISFIVLASFANPILAQNIDFGFAYSKFTGNAAIRNIQKNINSSVTILEEEEVNTETFGATIGYYGPIWKINDNQAIGGFGAGRFTMNYFDKRVDYGMQLSASVIYKRGAFATVYSEKDFGAGIGGGIMLHAFSMEIPFTSNISGISPFIIGEVTVWQVIFRYYYHLGRLKAYYRNYSGLVPKLNVKPMNFDFSLIFPID